MINREKTIALVCTGSTFSSDLEVKSVQHYLKKTYQLQTTYREDTYRWLSPEQRAKIFLDHLRNEEITAIWVLRGGEGTADIMPHLHLHQAEISKLSPKPLIGFSDFTPILNYFSQNFSWLTVHSIGTLRLVDNTISSTTESMTMNLLLKGESCHDLKDCQPLNPLAEQAKKVEGKICGGTLSLLAISIKDTWAFQTKDKIVIIEDVAEKPHVIYRTLKYLQRVDFFEQAKAIVFGDFEAAARDSGIIKVLRYFARDIGLPVYQTKAFGHGETNKPLIFGDKHYLVSRLG